MDEADYVGFSTIEAGGASPSTLIIRYVAPVFAGDHNGDGSVDAADYTVWRDGLGEAFTAADYDVWKQDFGASATALGFSSHVAVPEPASLYLEWWQAC